LWIFAAVDGSLHLVDGMTDQAIRGTSSKWGSDVATVNSNCGAGTQLLVSDSGDAPRDSLRAFEIPDRDPLPVSAAAEFRRTDRRAVARERRQRRNRNHGTKRPTKRHRMV